MMTLEQIRQRFSPPCGDRTRKYYITRKSAVFSSPYGDCTHIENGVIVAEKFSPPYGDCTEAWHDSYKAILFSPPYGDCTLNISQNTAKLKSRMAGKCSLYYNDVLLR